MEKEQQTQTNDIITKTDTVTDKLELLKWTAQIQSTIRKDISSDYILSKPDDKEKEAMIEMYVNAVTTKKMLTKLTTTKKWTWNRQTNNWQQHRINNQEQEYIKILAQMTFDSIMCRMHMIANLTRNKDKNPLLNKITQMPKTTETEEETENKPLKLLAPNKPETEPKE